MTRNELASRPLLAPPSPQKFWNVHPYLRYWLTWYDGLARVARAVACRGCYVECVEVTKNVITEGIVNQR